MGTGSPLLGGLNVKGALEEASCGKTTYRLQKVVVKNEAYITLVAGAYEATPEEAPTLSLIIDFLSCFSRRSRVQLGRLLYYLYTYSI